MFLFYNIYLRAKISKTVKTIIIVILLSASFFIAKSQNTGNKKILLGVEIDGDTVLYHEVAPVYVYPHKNFRSKRFERRYWRLVRKVKKVYPYAKKANELLREYSDKYEATNDNKLRKKYMKQAEDELFKQYGPELKKLSISEGRILIKLIDRETGATSYQLIQDLKGKLSAFFWQGIARLFGNDLKAEYDPETEDRLIEEIIFNLDSNVIK